MLLFFISIIFQGRQNNKKRKVLEIECVCFEHYVFEREEKKPEKGREAGRILFLLHI